MLRVGLTGDLGSGKSTVGRMLQARGAVLLSSDEMGRAMMQPDEPVYQKIVAHFGAGVVAGDGSLDRQELARLAFAEGRVAELNAIVHPAVLAEQARLLEAMARRSPDTVVVIESALIFSVSTASADSPAAESDRGGWHTRFDRIVLVTAPKEAKMARFVARASSGQAVSPERHHELAAEARRRLAAQGSAEAYREQCLVIANDGDLTSLKAQVDELWFTLADDLARLRQSPREGCTHLPQDS